MRMPVTLIVDDEPDIRELLEITLNRMQIKTFTAENLATAQQLLSTQSFDLCLTDMNLPDGDGLDLLEYINSTGLQLPVAIITAYGSMDNAIKAMKKGAFDFVCKPVDLSTLRQLVNHALELSKPKSVDEKVERRIRHILLGDSEVMCAIRSKIHKVARNQAPVYISGESGSGKELVAKLIHEQSYRNKAPFVAINCGAIPAELMESEFFGHKKGSFTGAISDKQGLFQAANGGTLFLDEVADLPLTLQVKLLRAIQEKKVRPVGEHAEIHVDIRLLSATHKDLGSMVQNGSFRQDLYYRINVIELNLPALRTRPADIPELSKHLIVRLANRNGTPVPKLSANALQALKQYYFPGNVRELENILERAMALDEDGSLDLDDLNLPIGMNSKAAEDFDSGKMSLENYLEGIEKKAVTTALEENRWNKTATAKQLGLTFRSLRYRLKKLGLE
ncbi:sigma-54 dependent transcriptional regulator [Methylomonas sp. AM2-LC]|uniref:sigma-54-dependent transcriptional regulator n=1 Tax=Methylomonas sp. AM2-LC TaxID=3153301 RepID=UPI0032648ACA